MLTRMSVLADLAVLVTLLAVVSLFSERDVFDWVFASVMFVSVTVSGAVVRYYQSKRATPDS